MKKCCALLLEKVVKDLEDSGITVMVAYDDVLDGVRVSLTKDKFRKVGLFQYTDIYDSSLNPDEAIAEYIYCLGEELINVMEDKL